MAQDNWKHRSSGMVCDTCMFFVPKVPGPIGRCRRRAPSLNGWPAVFPSDWCGYHKLDEQKLAVPDFDPDLGPSTKGTGAGGTAAYPGPDPENV